MTAMAVRRTPELDPSGTEEGLQLADRKRRRADAEIIARLEDAPFARHIADRQVDRAGSRRTLQDAGEGLDFARTVDADGERNHHSFGQLPLGLFQAEDAAEDQAGFLAGAL